MTPDGARRRDGVTAAANRWYGPGRVVVIS